MPRSAPAMHPSEPASATVVAWRNCHAQPAALKQFFVSPARRHAQAAPPAAFSSIAFFIAASSSRSCCMRRCERHEQTDTPKSTSQHSCIVAVGAWRREASSDGAIRRYAARSPWPHGKPSSGGLSRGGGAPRCAERSTQYPRFLRSRSLGGQCWEPGLSTCCSHATPYLFGSDGQTRGLRWCDIVGPARLLHRWRTRPECCAMPRDYARCDGMLQDATRCCAGGLAPRAAPWAQP